MVSRQSQEINSIEELENKFHKLKERLTKDEVYCPDYWGGYAVSIDAIEFWEKRDHRLHKRSLFTRLNDGWKKSYLAP